MRKLIPYLLLNFIVSAAAMLLVLLIWNATHKVPETSFSLSTTQFAVDSANNQPPPIIPLDQKTFEIQTVVGAGDINMERIQFVSTAEMSINLEGWKVQNGHGKAYTFPSIIIYPGGGLNLFTKSGINSSVEVFWGMSDAVWSSGNTVKLVDPQGNLRASYRIP